MQKFLQFFLDGKIDICQPEKSSREGQEEGEVEQEEKPRFSIKLNAHLRHCWRAYFFPGTPVFKHRSYFPVIIFPRHNTEAERRSNEIARFLFVPVPFFFLSLPPYLFFLSILSRPPLECRGPSRALLQFSTLAFRIVRPSYLFLNGREQGLFDPIIFVNKVAGNNECQSTVLNFASRSQHGSCGKNAWRGAGRGKEGRQISNERRRFAPLYVTGKN